MGLMPRFLRSYLRSFRSLAISVAILLGFLTLFITHYNPKQSAAAESFAPSIDGTNSVAGEAVTLQPEFKIVIDPAEPLALQKAAQDLQRDTAKVLGKQSPIVASPQDLTAGQPGVVITYQATSTAAFRDTALTGEESHEVSVRTVNGVPTVVLQGADLRGTIYAVYTFSDKFLGVPPLWYWSQWLPVTKATIQFPANQGILVGTPQVKYRTWFLNNLDLWSDWNPASGADKYDRFVETMLRMKLNTWWIGESVGEYDQGAATKARIAQDRGLVLAVNSLNQFRKWDQYWSQVKGTTIPPLSLATEQDKANMYEYWKYSIKYVKDHNLDVLWLIGFRGRGDSAYWDDIASSPTTDAERGKLEGTMIAKQMSLIREVTGNQHPRMALHIWNELSDMTVAKTLTLPQDPDLIWNFGNDIRDHFPRTDIQTISLPSSQPIGYYMNLQFYSTGSHLAEGEGIWKAVQNYKLVDQKRTGQRINLAILNVGNLREFLLTGVAASEMFWNIPNYNADTGFAKVLSRYFGDIHGANLANLYKTMLNGYWKQKPVDAALSGKIDRQYIFHDLRIQEAANIQLDQIKKKSRNLNLFSENEMNRLRIDVAYNNATTQVGAVMNGSNKAQSDLTTAAANIDAYTGNLPASTHQFYTSTFRSPAHFLRDSYAALYNVTRGHFKYAYPAEARCYLEVAQYYVNKMQTDLNEAAAPQEFANWYAGESLFNVAGLKSNIASAMTVFPDQTCQLPSDTPTPTATLTPTPTSVVTPTPTPTTVTVSPYASSSTLRTSTVKDAKRTHLLLTKSQTVKQLACYNCGAGTYKLYASNSSGTLSSVLSSGSLTNSSGWGTATINKSFAANTYLVFEFTPVTTPVYYGITTANTTYINFMRYATAGAPSWKTGAWQIRVTLTPTTTTATIPSPTATPTPTPVPVVTNTPTPTPTSTTLNATAYPSSTTFRTSSVKDAKRTLIKIKNALTLTSIGCYKCGTGTFTLYSSDSTGALKSKLASGTLSATTNNWNYANINQNIAAGSYLVFEFTPTTTPVYYYATLASKTDLDFMKYATSGAPTWKTGAWQLTLTYSK